MAHLDQQPMGMRGVRHDKAPQQAEWKRTVLLLVYQKPSEFWPVLRVVAPVVLEQDGMLCRQIHPRPEGPGGLRSFKFSGILSCQPYPRAHVS